MREELSRELALEKQARQELETIRKGFESVRDLHELRTLAMEIVGWQVRRYYLQRLISEGLIAAQSEMLNPRSPQPPRRNALEVIAGWLGGLG